MKTSQQNKPAQTENAPRKFKKYMKRRLALTFITVALVLFALVAVIIKIVVTEGDDYSITVLAQQTYTSETIAAKRGEITDRNGTLLATNEAVYNLILDPSILTSDENILDPTVALLVECFGYDSEDLYETINADTTSQYIIYEKGLTDDDIAEFLERQEEINDDNSIYDEIDGVWFEVSYNRIYPYSTLACDLIGFASSDGLTGNYGIEQYYNDLLVGVDGRKYGSVNSDSNAEIIVREAQDGATIVSTIDVNLQLIIEEIIAEFNEEIGSANTAVIVMDPNSGEVLAMASYPYFDLNDPTDLTVSGYYTDEEIEAMTDEEYTEALNEIWKNFITQTTYEPGSTAKPLTIAAGLEEGILDPSDTFYCDGGETIGSYYIKCHNTSGHGTMDLAGAIVNSCNDALMSIGLEIGADILSKYQYIFNLGYPTGVDLPAEEYGILQDADSMGDVDIATNAFGQNFNVTMMQMAAAYCSIINGGTYYTPHVVKEIIYADGTIETIEAEEVRQTISESTSEFLCEAMLAMVDGQTTYSTAIEGYEIGGKTGTAQKLPRDDNTYIVSFATFIPATDAEYFMMVVIDEPDVEDQSAGGYATSLTKSLWEAMIPYLNLYPTRDTGTSDEDTAAEEEAVEEEAEAEEAEASDTDAEAADTLSEEENGYGDGMITELSDSDSDDAAADEAAE